MITEELYKFIKEDDLDSLEEYLQSVDPVTYPQLKKIDSLISYAIMWDKLDAIKLLISYNANPEQYMNLVDLARMYNCSDETINYLKTGI